jgi:hypothetical protein
MPTLKGGKIEAVYIPEKKRGTLCVSSQVGCSMKCSFCATGAMSKANLRNLSAGEIVGQVLQARRLLAATAETRVMLQDDVAADDDDDAGWLVLMTVIIVAVSQTFPTPQPLSALQITRQINRESRTS